MAKNKWLKFYNTVDQSPPFSLSNFEGTLDQLLHLIQKEEVDICGIAIQELTKQLLSTLENSAIEMNAELMGLMAILLLIKSQKLLPIDNENSNEPLEDPRTEIIEKLREYCRFRDTATTLLSREEAQKAYFPRAVSPAKKELGTGLEEIGLDALKEILLTVLKRIEKTPQLIHDDEWHVAQKIALFRQMTAQSARVVFDTIFSEEKCRNELIVSFLALLEMMKNQELRIVRENNCLYIVANDWPKSI